MKYIDTKHYRRALHPRSRRRLRRDWDRAGILVARSRTPRKETPHA